MELRAYSDRVSQVLHLNPYVWGDTLIAGSDRETQPLWLEVFVTIRLPDACHALRVGADATALLELLPDMLAELEIDPDAVRLLRCAGYAEVELRVGPDATATVQIATNSAERRLLMQPEAEARLQVRPDGTARLHVRPDASAQLLGSGCHKRLQVQPDAAIHIVLDVCDD